METDSDLLSRSNFKAHSKPDWSPSPVPKLKSISIEETLNRRLAGQKGTPLNVSEDMSILGNDSSVASSWSSSRKWPGQDESTERFDPRMLIRLQHGSDSKKTVYLIGGILLAILLIPTLIAIGYALPPSCRRAHPFDGSRGTCAFRGMPAGLIKGLNGSIILEVKEGNALDFKLRHTYLQSALSGKGELFIFDNGDIGFNCSSFGEPLSFHLDDDKPVGYLGNVTFNYTNWKMEKNEGSTESRLNRRVSLIGRMLVVVATILGHRYPVDCCIISAEPKFPGSL